jgi:hypothetical protein
MSQKTKSVIGRFIKGAVSGAFTAMALVTWATPTSWTELPTVLSILGLVGIAGAINGAILAGQKYASWVE